MGELTFLNQLINTFCPIDMCGEQVMATLRTGHRHGNTRKSDWHEAQ